MASKLPPYSGALRDAMSFLGRDERTIFLGQAVGYPGTAMTVTLEDVPKEKIIEMPVAEEMQMGVSIGMALNGFIPVSIYPRWNFLILAANQMVNHLDKLPLISGYRPKVIIRTGIGSVNPLDPGWQHKGDMTDGFRRLFQTVTVERLEDPEQIFTAYVRALKRDGSTILVEVSDYYSEK